MTAGWLPRQDRFVYLGGFLLAAVLIYATRFTSHDGDSALYAALAGHAADAPVGQWVAPRWWALWPGSTVDELFVEHPAGLFWLPAALGKLGLPAGPSSYVVGLGASLGVLLGLAALADRIAGRLAARATLLLVPWLPVAFIFRVRANHEYPMLGCLVLTLVALDRVRAAWPWLLAVSAALVAALLIKGVFALLVVGGGGLWLLTNPAADDRGRLRSWIAYAVGLGAMAVAARGYDVWYQAVTGHPFWHAYWQRQVGPMTFASPVEQAGVVVRHLRFYAEHVAWHSAPWGLALAVVGLRRIWRTPEAPLTGAERRGLVFLVAFVAASFIGLSVPSRVAERYTFSATFLLGTAGLLAALRTWPRLADWIGRADRAVPALPALLWTALVVGRLALGPG
jgi:4-amino-4-deoxy-L-arabinose transferase-like glycosyltransferase